MPTTDHLPCEESKRLVFNIIQVPLVFDLPLLEYREGTQYLNSVKMSVLDFLVGAFFSCWSFMCSAYIVSTDVDCTMNGGTQRQFYFIYYVEYIFL